MNKILNFKNKWYSLILFAFLLVLTNPVKSQSTEWPWANDNPELTTILLLGDTNIQFREKPEMAFKYLLPTLKNADFRFLNLEGPFAGGTDDPSKTDIPHKNWRHSNPDQVGALTYANIDAVGVANNVTYPWQALMRSLQVLDSVGIAYTGGGENIEKAHQPVIVEKKGLKVGFMQFAATVFPTNHAATDNQPGIAEIKIHTAYQPPPNIDKPGQPPIVKTWMDENSKNRMVRTIYELRKNSDIVVVSFHWGVSGTVEPVSYQSEVAHTVLDAGADLVIGHGPHKYQKIEMYKGKPIFHSLGQAVFDDRRDNRFDRHREGLLLRIAVNNKEVHSISLVPTWREEDNNIRLYNPNTGKGRELFEYLKSVNKEGAPLVIKNKEIQIEGLR